jgi:hypothetical protein
VRSVRSSVDIWLKAWKVSSAIAGIADNVSANANTTPMMIFITGFPLHVERDLGVYQVQRVMRFLRASFPTFKPPAVVTVAARDENNHNS